MMMSSGGGKIIRPQGESSRQQGEQNAQESTDTVWQRIMTHRNTRTHVAGMVKPSYQLEDESPMENESINIQTIFTDDAQKKKEVRRKKKNTFSVVMLP